MQQSEEEFISDFCQDKRKEVREAAFSVLENLPTGFLQNQLLNIAKKFISLDKKNSILQVEMPEKYSDELAQVNIKANFAQIEGGEKASWLYQLASKLNPDNWLQIAELDIKKWLELFLNSDWKKALLAGIWTAAQHFQSQNWLLAIHQLYLQTYQQNHWKAYPEEKLPAGLDDNYFNKVAILYIADAKNGFSDAHPLINLLNNAPKWDMEVSKEILNIIDNHSSKDNFSLYYGLKALLQRAAYAVHPQIYDFARQLWEQPTENKAYNWIKDFRQFLSILQIRNQIQSS